MILLSPRQVVGAVGFAGQRLQLPQELDPNVARLIMSCWSTNALDRPSFDQILKMLKMLKELPLCSTGTPQTPPAIFPQGQWL